MKLAWWMWCHRLHYRLRLWWDLITLLIDIWVFIYLVIPPLLVAGWYYVAWLNQIPTWFRPEYMVLVPPILGIIMLVGSPRTYLSRADLVYVYPHQKAFQWLLIAGKVVSTLVESLLLWVFWWGIYPFYLHIYVIDTGKWLFMGGLLLLMRWTVLQLKWKLRARVNSNLLYWLVTGILWLVWNYTIGRSLLMPSAPEFMLLAVVWILLPALITLMLKVSRWESIIADEEYRDLQLMRMFLGHAAQASLPAGRKGRARLWKGRMGIPFKPDYTLAYFFSKLMLRQRKIWGLYLQVYSLGLLVALQNLTFEFRLLILALAVGAVGMLTELLWREHAEDLFLRMLPLTWDNCRRAVTKVVLLVSLPLCMVPLGTVGMGTLTWPLALLGMAILVLVALVIAGYIGLKLATRLNLRYNEP